jgi:hypothetical protein
MKKTIDIHVGMIDLHTKKNPLVAPFVKARLKDYPDLNLENGIFWGEASFGLDKVELFQKLPDEKKHIVLEELSQDRIEEAFHIEKSGTIYGAKMIALSQTIDDRLLYGCFVGDEIRHFAMVRRYLLREELDCKSNPFLHYLDELLENGPKLTLVFMIQVLLEGWGIDHYTMLMNDCLNSDLKADLKSILVDEASHHGSGVAIFDENNLDDKEKEYLKNVLSQFLKMIRMGPLRVIRRLDQVISSLNEKDHLQILKEMGADDLTNHKLRHFKTLIEKAGAKKILREINESGLLDEIA